MEHRPSTFNRIWPHAHTPYARAIMRAYRDQVPFFESIPTTLTGTVRETKNITAPGYLFDVLIMGCHIDCGTADEGDNGQQIFMNVEDRRSNIAWVTPGPISASPLTAFGGSRFEPNPVLQLPEAFFLHKNTDLTHSFTSVGGDPATGGSITWCGVQLLDPIGGQSPEFVTMPDGSVIAVGSRMPWYSTMGLGTEISVIGEPVYVLGTGNKYLSYTPSTDCDVEIHGINANWFHQGDDLDRHPENVMFQLADTEERKFWSQNKPGNPAVSIMGTVDQAYPTMPFTKPYLLKRNHQLRVTTFNLDDESINRPFLTFVGVRRCLY